MLADVFLDGRRPRHEAEIEIITTIAKRPDAGS